ncbi:MAG: ferredoxin--NADP reductase [Pseudomonadota bacterium]
MDTDTLPTDKATLETVTSVQRWTDALFSFKTTRPNDFRFTPGQYARLGLPESNSDTWRAYSITSAPDDDFLEYYGVLVPGGRFTTMLNDLQPGARIWTEKAVYGFMTADRFNDGDDLWMLATGTGIGPFISILRDPAVWSRFRRLVLVHGVRKAEELSYRDELRALQETPPQHNGEAGTAQLHIIATSTRETADQPGLLQGRITTLLENGLLENAAGVPITVDASRIMLCGNPSMIEDTRRLLHQRGMRPVRRTLPGQFVTENYW